MRSPTILMALAVAMPLGTAEAGSFKVNEPIAIKDVKHVDPHRGTTYLRDATFTVLGYEEHATVQNQLFVTSKHEIKADGKFVVVFYTVENHASDTLDSYPVFFGGASLSDGKNDYPVSKVSGQFAEALKLDMQGKRMPPGESIRSCIAFDVPESATPGTLTLDLIDATVALAPMTASPKAEEKR